MLHHQLNHEEDRTLYSNNYHKINFTWKLIQKRGSPFLSDLKLISIPPMSSIADMYNSIMLDIIANRWISCILFPCYCV